MFLLKHNKWGEFPGWECGEKKRAFQAEETRIFASCREYGLTKVRVHAGKC